MSSHGVGAVSIDIRTVSGRRSSARPTGGLVERDPHSAGRMTQRSVETLIGRLVTDPAARRRFAEHPAAVLHEFREGGHELTAVELEALASTDAQALRALAETLDPRLRRVDVKPRTEE